MGIRTKFILTLILAAIVPLTLALISVRYIGKRYYLEQQGQQFGIMAHDLSSAIEHSLELRVRHLYRSIETSDIGMTLDNYRLPIDDLEALPAYIERMEKGWANLADDDLLKFSRHPAATMLHDIQAHSPLFAEMFVTDKNGCVVGFTNPTSDYWQADEAWWQTAAALKPGQVLVTGITYDTSARVFAYEICIPLYRPGRPELVGVVKSVLNATPLLVNLLQSVKKTGIVREVVFDDGEVFVRVGKAGRAAVETRFPIDKIKDPVEAQNGFMIMDHHGEGKVLAGFTSVELGGQPGSLIVSEMIPQYIVVHETVNNLLRPVNKELNRLFSYGLVSIVIFFFAGWYIADRRILFPLTELEKAASSLSKIAFDPEQKQIEVHRAEHLLERIRGLRTRDEFERLNRAFARMAERALHYREHMQQEVMDKTAEIQKDLATARHFQEALLPDRVPHISAMGDIIPYEVSFCFRYQPCVTLGGDFFDVITLSDHEVAVFIADVMGHGASSALVTSMLRTLLHSESMLRDPAIQMNYLHLGFREIIDRMSQPFFVTCCLMVVDAENRKITYCSAGHPAPLLLQDGEARPLYGIENNQPAVGLIPEMDYRSYVIDLPAPSRLVLYTDGMVEAQDSAEEEYGLLGLQNAMAEGADMSLDDMTEHLMQHWRDFLGPVEQADDVCLVTIDIDQPDPHAA